MRQTPRLLALMLLTAALLAGVAAADTAADEALLKKNHLGTDGPELLDYFRQRTVTEGVRLRIAELVKQLGSDQYALRERAGMELIEIGWPAVGLLRQNVTNPDVEVARRAERCLKRIGHEVPISAISAAVARLVAVRKPPDAAGVLLGYLPFADDEVVATEVREALTAVAMPNGRPDPVLEAALKDSVASRRAAAAEALIRTGVKSAIKASRAGLNDRDPDVKLRTALALVVYAKDRSTVAPMIRLMGELPQAAGWRIEEVLIRLAGDGSPSVSLDSSDAARKKCSDAWLEWWKANEPKIDLARLDQTPPTLGYTLILVRHSQSLEGSVMEIDAEKKVMWRIDHLQLPTDAVIVGKDRVLITEQTGGRVSERDFRGKVIWSHAINQAVGAQRLPNGHTLIVCRTRLVELDGDQKEIWQHTRPQNDIVAATKLPSGEILFLTHQGACIRLDQSGRTVKTIHLPRGYYGFGSIERLAGGRLLVTEPMAVAEIDLEGTTIWSTKAERPTSAQRLPNGNTLIASSGTQTIHEVDRDGRVIWQYHLGDGSYPYKAHRR